MVIRNHLGLVMGSSWQCISASLSLQCAEAAGLLCELRFAADLGISLAVVESDAASVVTLINGPLVPKSKIDILVHDIRILLGFFNVACVLFTPRLANSVAYGLAKFALSSQLVGFLVDSVPPIVESLVRTDVPG
ncbi:hypothetical protein ACOSQ4_021049 [Xanthoceras sorbifolium]